MRKGTHVGIVTATLRALEGEFGCRPADMLVGVGPCIGADCYEVGEDVAGLFREAFPTATANGFTNVPHNKTVKGTRNETGGATGMRMGVCCSQRAQEGFQILRDIGGGKSLLDLRGANVLQLLDGGVLPEHITVSGLCPHCHPELFFSHRGMGAVRGGMAAFLGLI
ncbi:MAG: polyphenol oxidase family protein [Lachnospiraceae bacterium]|nr:polyphenol oxidase family protein [Lachnospiraceae bacterium]